MSRIILDLLPFFLLWDLLLPFLLAPTYRGYSHVTQVMSVLGNTNAPLHPLYNGWLVVLGVEVLAGGFALYPIIAPQSAATAAILFVILCAYATGACILSGIFPVGETKEMATFSAKIHGCASAIGFMLLAFGPLCIALYFFKTASGFLGVFSVACFALALLFFALFMMSDKPKFQGSHIAFEGLWQRLSLLFMYLPICALCMAEKLQR